MAMSGSGMAAAVLAALKTVNPDITGAAETKLQSELSVIYGAVVQYIQANAEVTGTAGGDPIAGGQVQ